MGGGGGGWGGVGGRCPLKMAFYSSPATQGLIPEAFPTTFFLSSFVLAVPGLKAKMCSEHAHRKHTHSLSLSHAHTHTHTRTLSLSLSLTHTHNFTTTHINIIITQAETKAQKACITRKPTPCRVQNDCLLFIGAVNLHGQVAAYSPLPKRPRSAIFMTGCTSLRSRHGFIYHAATTACTHRVVIRHTM